MKSTFRPFFIASIGALLLAGCSTSGWFARVPSRSAKPVAEDGHAPRNYVGDARLPASIRRVVLLPVHGGEFALPEDSESLDPVMATALERQMRFEVVTLPREDCMHLCGQPDISSAASLPHDFLRQIGDKYDAQAVLFVDVTAYEAYRPLTLGLRAKLASVADQRLIWSFDEIYSTSDPAVVAAVRTYYQHNELGNLPFDLSQDALQSPSRFAAYAANQTFHTLPIR